MRLRGLNRRQAEDLREDLADLYVKFSCHGARLGAPQQGGLLHRLAGDLRYPGFATLVAESPEPAGCAFGFPVRRDGSWRSGFHGALPQSIERLTASGRVSITAMVVHPSERNRGLVGRLQERLLAGDEMSLGATLVDQANRTIFAAFRSWGRRAVGEVHRPPGHTVLRAPVLPVGEPKRRSRASPHTAHRLSDRRETRDEPPGSPDDRRGGRCAP
jgi:hypothetical protein